jgi:c-di-AMP phosphodiesterase-like protein
MTDQDGTIIWHNEQFSEIVGQKITKKSITQIFPGLYKKVFPQNGQMKEYCITHEEHKYHVECRNMVFKNLEQRERYRKIKRHREIFFRYFTFLMRRSLLVTKKSPGRRVWLLD